jgi:DNA-directed RNA polymerase specialized sigma24 family protein
MQEHMTVQDDRSWRLTREALDGLLGRLARDRAAAAAEYETLRGKLIVFFELRSLRPGDVLADQVLDRLARKLEAGETIDNPRSYCYGLAQYVGLEHQRTGAKAQAALETLRARPADDGGAAACADERLACMETCMKALPHDDSVLILSYCRQRGGRDGRLHLAERLRMSPVNLRTRVHRIRRQLVACREKCLAGSHK